MSRSGLRPWVHASYSAGFDVRRAQTEPLERFLTDCHIPKYRRIAKLSILQRIGAAYLDRFASRIVPARCQPVFNALAITGVVETAQDPDLGLLIRATDGLWLVEQRSGRPHVVFRRHGPEGPDEIEDEDLRLQRAARDRVGAARAAARRFLRRRSMCQACATTHCFVSSAILTFALKGVWRTEAIKWRQSRRRAIGRMHGEVHVHMQRKSTVPPRLIDKRQLSSYPRSPTTPKRRPICDVGGKHRPA